MNLKRMMHDFQASVDFIIRRNIEHMHYLEKDGIQHFTDFKSYIVSYEPNHRGLTDRPPMSIYVGTSAGVRKHLKSYGISSTKKRRK